MQTTPLPLAHLCSELEGPPLQRASLSRPCNSSSWKFPLKALVRVVFVCFYTFCPMYFKVCGQAAFLQVQPAHLRVCAGFAQMKRVFRQCCLPHGLCGTLRCGTKPVLCWGNSAEPLHCSAKESTFVYCLRQIIYLSLCFQIISCFREKKPTTNLNPWFTA